MLRISFVLTGVFCLFLMQACFLFDPFINEVNVHNNLVLKLDDLCESESLFNAEYKLIFDNEDVDLISLRYSHFNEAFLELDKYFDDTWFESEQKVFVSEYEDNYRDFLVSYLELSENFIDIISERGIDIEYLEYLLDDLDRHALLFYDYHNSMNDIVNSQVLEIE